MEIFENTHYKEFRNVSNSNEKNNCFYLLNFLAAQKNFKILRNATKTICKPSNSKIFTVATYNL